MSPLSEWEKIAITIMHRQCLFPWDNDVKERTLRCRNGACKVAVQFLDLFYEMRLARAGRHGAQVKSFWGGMRVNPEDA
jgi:hypothetical protein